MTTTEETASPSRKRSLIKGFLAGAVGGLVGAAAKAAGEAVYPPRTLGQIPPPAVLVNRMVDHPLTEKQEEVSVRRFTGVLEPWWVGCMELWPSISRWSRGDLELTLA